VQSAQLNSPEQVADRLTQPIRESAMVTLKGTVHPLTRKATDRGALGDGTRLERIQIQLGRSDKQEAALQQMIHDLHTPGTASYHKWLTPQQFGERFGASDGDIATITKWLQGHGFGPVKVNPGKQTLETSATAGQFRDTFHSQIKMYEINGERHYANATDPQIPAALAPVFRGFVSLNNFRLKSTLQKVGTATYDPATRKSTLAPRLGWTTGTDPNPYFVLAPGDFAVQYDLNPLYAAGIDGTGQTIAIINDSNIDLSLVNAYRSLFGLPVNPPQVIIDGNDPGIDGVNNPDGPNYASGEAYLDVELAGAVAPKAQIDLVIAGDTALESGVVLAAEDAVYGNLAPVISLSLTECEMYSGSVWSYLWEQAAAQGITVMVSSGDAGSAGCDDFDVQEYAVGGQAVNGIGSTPYNVSVGGTDFHYSSSSLLTNYWANDGTNFPVNNSTPVTTLLSPVPEQAWNDSQYSPNLLSYYQLTGGQTTIVAGSGGASTCGVATTDPQTGQESCTPYPKPVWQTGSGVPTDGARDLPDVSLFAANGLNYSFYPICANAGDCQPVTAGASVQFSGAGGTSASSPAFAGIMALVNQKTGSRQGQADFVLYPLAAQYPNSFHDVTAGNNAVPCNIDTTSYGVPSNGCIAVFNPLTVTDPYYGTATEGVIGTGSAEEYKAGTGYDLASGLGSIDAYNLVNNWSKVAFNTTTTTLTPSATTFAHGTSVTISGSVTGTTSPLPTGDVVLMTTSGEPFQASEAFFNLSGGSYSGSIGFLPGGSYTIYGQYGGDSLNAGSTSAPVSITVTPENTSLTVDLLSTNSNTVSMPSGSTIPYGQQVLLSAIPVPTSFYNANSACIAGGTVPYFCGAFNVLGATGSVAFTDSGSALSTAVLNSEGDAEYNAVLGVGSHSIVGAYSGDATYNPSTSPAVALTVVKDVPRIGAVAATPSAESDNIFPAGQAITITIGVENFANGTSQYASYAPALAPTGTLTFSGAPAGSPTSATLSPSKDPATNYAEGIATATIPATAAPGTYTITTNYSGDANYAAVSYTSTITIQSPKVISTVAGDGYPGFSGDGGPATNAQLGYVGGTAVDSAGNLYIADYGNSRIRAVNKTTGVITTVAGNGGGGFSGDGGLATSAQLAYPLGVAVDAKGNLYIADTYNCRIRMVTATTGIISTIAGNGNCGYSGDSGLATSAEISQPQAVAVDSAGNVYIADAANYRVRMVTAATGLISTVAGNGSFGASGDGGAATAASLSQPGGLAVDASGNIFISDTDNQEIREVIAATGLISTFAGNGVYGYNGDGGAAASAQFAFPQGIALDAAGDLFIADNGNSVIRVVAAGTRTVSTVAGDGAPGYSGDGGNALYAALSYPTGVAVDAAGDIFIADAENTVVREVSAGGSASSQATAAPAFSPVPGVYSSTVGVTLSDATAGASIYYTLDGSAPTSASSVYSGAIAVSSSTIIRAIATAPNLTQSAVTAAAYLIPPNAPEFSPAGGIYTGVQTVTIKDNTPGTYFYYTTDGSDPNDSSTARYYQGPITVSSDSELKAVAYSSQFFYAGPSPITTANYVIKIPTVTVPNYIISTVAGNGISGSSGDGGLAINAELGYPGSTAVDTAGNLYIADEDASVIRKVTKSTGVITTVVGTGVYGYSGDGGLATQAQISSPAGIAIDAAGDIYFSDIENFRVRKVTAGTGIITTVVGTGTYGTAGDGGAATSAQITYAEGLALDSSGNLFIADTSSSRIREVAAGTGIITTVAGSTTGNSGDGGVATSAQLSYPNSLAVDSADNIYIADTGNDVIREVSASTGIISTIAGNGSFGHGGDQGLAIDAQLEYPQGVGVDGAGDVFIADTSNYVIREVVAGTGVIITVAGTNTAGYGGDGGPALGAQLDFPASLALDAAGDVFISDTGNYVVRELSVAGSLSSQVTATPTFTPGPGVYNAPTSITISDTTPNATIYYTLDGSTPTTSSTTYTAPLTPTGPTVVRAFATAPNFTPSLLTAAGYQLPPAAPVFTPAAGTYASAQTVTITDATPGAYFLYTTDGSSPISSSTAQYYSGPISVAFNETLQAVALNSSSDYGQFSPVTSASYVITGNPINGAERVISTVAGNGIGGYSGDGGPAINAKLYYPGGSAVDSAGNIYIADSENNRVRMVNKSTGVITTIAGTEQYGFSGDGGPAVSAQLDYPSGVAVDSAGNIYIADSVNFKIRKIAAGTGIISTVAGNGQYGFSGDGGPATSAALTEVFGVVVDGAGNLYIADTYNNRIRKVSASTGIITTVAGSGDFGDGGDYGPATSAQLSFPNGVAVDASGNLFIADTENSEIRRVDATTGTITRIAGYANSGYAGDGGPASEAALSYPEGVGVDSAGDVFIADSGNSVVREIIASTDVIATIAGNGAYGYGGDGGPAVNAQFSYPQGVAVDSSGNVFITDNGSSTIREVYSSANTQGSQVTATPVFTPAPGSYSATTVSVTITDSTPGATIYYTTDGSTPTTSSAVFSASAPVTVTSSTVFRAFATAPNYAASAPTAASYLLAPAAPTFTPPGGTYGSTQMVTLTDSTPGTGYYYTIDGSEPLYSPTTQYYTGPITVNASETLRAIAISLYFDAPASQVSTASYVIPADNVITTVAGSGSIGYRGDGGPATGASFNFASHAVADAVGNIYISDTYNNAVRKVAPDGTISTFVGNGQAGYSGDGGPSTSAQITFAEGLALDGAGNLYIADELNNVIRKVTPAGTISTVAGNGSFGYSGDGGAATSAQLAYPFAVAVDKAGDLFIADYQNQRVRMVDTSGNISTVAGSGVIGFSGDGGPAIAAQLFNPIGVAIDNAGHLYVADYDNGRIREVDLKSGTITTVAGGGNSGPGSPAFQAQIGAPFDVSVDSTGNFYFPTYQSRIGKVTVATGIYTSIAGDGTDGFSGDGGAATSAELNSPTSVGIDPSGNLYIADSSNARIRKVTYLRPVGNLEQAIDAATKSTTVPVTDTIFISGWVADPVDGSPMSNVTVFIDGQSIGTPTLGIARQDVATYFNQPSYANSGFNIAYAASQLAPGSHSVTVVAVDTNGLSTTLGPLTVTVTPVYAPPFGNLDMASGQASGSSTITTADTVVIGGWVADPTDGAPMSNVKVLIDGISVGTPTLGVARPDVATYYNNSAYLYSGFGLSLPAMSLTPGAHTVTVVATDSHGVSTTLGPLTVTIVHVNRPPVGNLELAVDSVTVKPTISQSGTLFVSGWSADYQDNGPAKSVQILIDGKAAGTATLGQARPDVVTYFNNPAWSNTGWTFTYAASQLATGTHTVTAVATDSLSLSTTFGPLTITVTK
jgi:sugar lactone lactonase YvrE